jgi:hypothetical protein
VRDGQVVDPSRRPARFHDDEIDLVLLEDGSEVIAVGGSVQKGVFPSFGVEKAAHGIELTEVESENFHDWFHGYGGWKDCDSGRQRDPRSRV